MIDDAQTFQEILIRTVGLGLAAFLICGLALASFLRSLHLDTREERGMSRRTAVALIVLIVTLTAFCLLFVWIAFG